MKLRTKIQLFSGLFMLILVVFVNLSVYFFFYQMSTDTELDELELTATDVMKALHTNPNVDPVGLMKAYLPANGMIRVIAENDVPIIEQTRSSEFLTLPWEFSNAESKRLLNEAHTPDVAVIEKPMIWPTGTHEGEIITIQVSNHLLSLHDTMRTLMYVLIVLSLVTLIPVIVASSVLSGFLLRPIQNLIKTMKQNMKLGKWQKIEVTTRSQDEIYQMEQTFNEMIDHLKSSYEKQEMFVSDASHELKTPIQIIKSYAQLLDRRDQLSPEVFKESIQAINSESDRIKKLVEQLLSLAKNKELYTNEKVNLTNIAEETALTFRDAYQRAIHVTAQKPELMVNGNQDQLKQIAYILIDNALKYSEKQVDVHVFMRDDSVFLQVKDYGHGISKEEQHHVFDRFYRVDQARNRDTGGTGLGLSIAKSIAEAHQADLYVNSEIGIGSTFTLMLRAQD
ncbi:HAMP domain-containing histidine kinase [Aquibacillus koreensis]|uniref:histidine kinase n=1 Tax=Aquibacillus koreensis TaxID=279446 RepID=A0A9X3WP39_9BACI|nr:HAMP domain-containing histidine kinase [Aquibacillus koreensis]MCT2535458.1 HAMP domain-containing histidine kinase [Aquibacillus koreensis]MDC3422293.1 HAMP domain-containing histidine kinase [Aquibacillus koreensis]